MPTVCPPLLMLTQKASPEKFTCAEKEKEEEKRDQPCPLHYSRRLGAEGKHDGLCVRGFLPRDTTAHPKPWSAVLTLASSTSAVVAFLAELTTCTRMWELFTYCREGHRVRADMCVCVFECV